MKKKIISLLLIATLTIIPVSLFACDGRDDTYLILVNKQNHAGIDYVPESLVQLDSKYTNGGKFIQLESLTAKAVVDMLEAMRRDGITNVSVTSGYRTYEYQKQLFENYCASESADHPTWSESEVKDYVLTYSAYPGTSEHQTGLCVDFITTEMSGLWNYGSETPSNPYDKGFAETAAYTWLQKHAHEYGFILRFPENKESVTGYSYESWHYRYVGVKHATEIHDQGLTLEEYLGQ